MGDVHGRWYPFSATAETIVCLEKQGLPDHLKQLPSIETPMTLQALLMDLEDVGEASDFPSTSIKLVHKKMQTHPYFDTYYHDHGTQAKLWHVACLLYVVKTLMIELIWNNVLLYHILPYLTVPYHLFAYPARSKWSFPITLSPMVLSSPLRSPWSLSWTLQRKMLLTARRKSVSTRNLMGLPSKTLGPGCVSTRWSHVPGSSLDGGWVFLD